MKSLMSYLLVMFAGIFWLTRVAVCITSSLGMEFFLQPYDITAEILLLFVTILSIALIVKRTMVGGLLYFFTYTIYFGVSSYTFLLNIINKTVSSDDILNMVICTIAIILPVCVIVDIFLDRKRSSSKSSKKTSWYFDNKGYDRQKDEREDKNNYRIS